LQLQTDWTGWNYTRAKQGHGSSPSGALLVTVDCA
jgi:hypothetical protein